MAQIMLFLGS